MGCPRRRGDASLDSGDLHCSGGLPPCCCVEMSQLTDRLSETELDAARLGFLQLLRRKRFSHQFVENHSDDLLARARLEYARQCVDGAEIDNPTGWLINCAWRRTQNLLTSQGRAPSLIEIDAAAPVADEKPTPEERVLELDRADQLQHAVDLLPIEERKVIELCYFEGMSVREIGRALRWDHAKADRRHHAALRHLRELLGVEDLDSLAIELGLAAWVSIATERGAGFHLPAGVEAVAEKAGHGIGEAWNRLHDLARRLLLGGAGEPASTAAAGGATRAAGVCGAAALACLASGVIGPGIGGVDLVGHGHRHAGPASTRTTDAFSTASAASASSPSSGTGSTASSSKKQGGKSSRAASTSSGSKSNSANGAAQAAAQQAQQEFNPFATGGGGSTTSSSTASTNKPRSSTSTGTVSSAAAKQTNQEFGAFK